MDMSPRITTPDHTRRLRGITLTILLALLISGCDKADRSDGQPSEDTVNVDRDITAASTPLAVTATAVNTADTLPQGTFDIRLSEGKFTIVANDAPARDILDDLAVLAGFVVVDSGTRRNAEKAGPGTILAGYIYFFQINLSVRLQTVTPL